ncbi:MAG: hypothetical protein NTW21_24695 [Verrucomicrobia bacterium]|nr:hypothetical protein [Verrucomicrobiota bacterium]
MKTQLLTAALTTVLVFGCASSAPPQGRADLLDFLADGQTRQRQVLARLGDPSGRFEGGNILTYRLGYDPASKGYQVVEREDGTSGWPTWLRAKFSLVMVFDDEVLRKHSLVEVN